DAVSPPLGGRASLWTGTVDEVVEQEPPPRREHVAVHEAGHAAMAIALGATVTWVQVDGSPQAVCRNQVGGWRGRALLLAAGDAAMDARAGWRCPLSDAEVIEHVRAIHELSFGPCDDCQIALQIVARVGQGASDDRYIAAYRMIENEAFVFFSQPHVR